MSHSWPDTRDTLIVKIRNREDQNAWDEFVRLYQPLIIRFAMNRGLQHADAMDICQRVLWTVARAVDDWEVGRIHGRFRGWLAKVTRNAVFNLVERDAKHRGSGISTIQELLEQTPEESNANFEEWRVEQDRQILRYAAELVQGRFQPESWALFWRTMIDEEPIAEVAEQMGKSIGAAYAIRSRILIAIRHEVKAILEREADETQLEGKDQ